MTEKTGLELLRTPFPPHQIGKLPKPKSKDAAKGYCEECGGWHGLPAVHLDYVGHAALTDRLLDVDPAWSWEPLAFDSHGLPAIDKDGGLWIRLTILGVTRLGYGDAQGKNGADGTKEKIGDALRNAAMRFGAALDLWHRGDLHLPDDSDTAEAVGRRTAWLLSQKTLITDAKNSGELKKIMASALAKTREQKDEDAENELLEFAAQKVDAATNKQQEAA